MKYNLLLFVALLSLSPVLCFAQEDSDSLFSRLRAISNNGTDFYNIDGIEITSRHVYEVFSKKAIVKAYRKFSVRENDLTGKEAALKEENYYVHKTTEAGTGLMQHTSYYFIKNSNDEITAISFAAINKYDHDFELKMVDLIYHRQIPRELFAANEIDSIDFAGRKISLGRRCHWMNINNIECNMMGQMNWSIHKTAEDAAKTVDDQFRVMLAGNKGKIKKDETVDVLFEGADVKAHKIVFDPKGLMTNLLIGMSGAKELTVYYVSAPVRGRYVSCVLSYWDRDYVTDSGLPPLLGEVMALKQ